ncbi:reverse transcriptase domain-containing protein, partial [Tanacetum coccineum]
KALSLAIKFPKKGIEVDKAKVDVIAKLPHPTTVKGVRSFLGHAGFYRRFIKDFSKISRPMTHLLEKNTPFIFSDDCIQAFQTLKKKLTEAPFLIAPDWDLPFKLMCDASDFAIGGEANLGKRIFKKRSKKKAKNKQIQAREGKDQVKSKSKVIRMRGILTLEGLKTASLKLLLQRFKKTRAKNCNLVSSMAKIDSKEAQIDQQLGFALDSPHTTSTLRFCSSKKHKLQVQDFGYK